MRFLIQPAGELTKYFPPAWLEREPLSLGYPIHSSALFCPICRQAWAETHAEPDEVHVPQMVSCEVCEWSDELHPVPGSLLVNDIFSDGVDWELLELLPPELLKREFNLTLRAYLKESQACPTPLYHSQTPSSSLVGF